ncbi:MAG TPA: 50S ribosomal protein L19e [Candidatus Nanoarchaeia archaeon]|nr:50S ribosomal protein L19e [Candidatus Nanoarchaeia archaeon]
MKLNLQKRLAASVLGCSEKRVVFDPARLEDIKEAITKTDVRLLIGEGAIREAPQKGVSRVRANKRIIQKRKGLRKGLGSRKGKSTAREPRKQAWMNRVRSQRRFIKSLKQHLKTGAFRELYLKSKGGFFRSVKHIKLYVAEHDMTLTPLQRAGTAAVTGAADEAKKKFVQKKTPPKTAPAKPGRIKKTDTQA